MLHLQQCEQILQANVERWFPWLLVSEQTAGRLQVAWCDLSRSPGEAGLFQPSSEPPTEGLVSEEGLPAAQHPGWSTARHHRVPEPVQTRKVELFHQPEPISVWTRGKQW